jgi:putative colanic acid biosynthesis acetyltransferase WcaF
MRFWNGPDYFVESMNSRAVNTCGSYSAPGSAFRGASFSFGNRLGRALWGAVWFVFCRFSPRPFHIWRAFILRCFGAQLGAGCHIYPGARIWAPWNLVCSPGAAIADDVIIYNQAVITLGERVVVSQGAHLCTGTHNYESPGFELIALPITVQARAWICAEVFIHPGVTVGEGAIVGARAVVTKDMPAWTICAGHPCAPMKPRARPLE